MARTKAIVGGGRYGREMLGIIVTFQAADGKFLTIHEIGKPSLALRDVCARALLKDPTFRVVSYSSPNTIYGDLDGSRADRVDAYGRTVSSLLPEAAALGAAGLLHMLHPRLARENRERRDVRTSEHLR